MPSTDIQAEIDVQGAGGVDGALLEHGTVPLQRGGFGAQKVQRLGQGRGDKLRAYVDMLSEIRGARSDHKVTSYERMEIAATN